LIAAAGRVSKHRHVRVSTTAQWTIWTIASAGLLLVSHLLQRRRGHVVDHRRCLLANHHPTHHHLSSVHYP
jgi:hypothetical protein